MTGSIQEEPAKKKTKRQHIKDLQQNDLNRWVPHHPKITSASKRNDAYLYDASIHPKQYNPDKRTISPDSDLYSPEIAFGRRLGSSCHLERHRAIASLQAYLKERCRTHGMSSLDFLKCWKGLYYCLYMADQVAVQDEVSKRISELVWCLIGSEEEDEFAGATYLQMIADEEGDEDEDEDEDEEDVEEVDMIEGQEEDEDEDVGEENKEEDSDKEEEDVDDEEQGEQYHGESTAEDGSTPSSDDEVKHSKGAHLVSLFYRTFFQTLKREWYNLDKYRIDKFYTLIRFMMREMYKYMSFRHWNYGIIRLLNDVLYEEVLMCVPNGIRLHVCDVVLEELVYVDGESGLKLTEATISDVLEPFLVVCASERDATVRQRAMEKILDAFLARYSVVNDAELQKVKNKSKQPSEVTTENEIFEQVHVESLAETIFGLASDERTLDKYRKSLYDVHKMYIRRIKDVGFDVDISMQQEDEDEVVLEYGEKHGESDSNEDQTAVKAEPQKSKKVDATTKSAHEEKHDKKHKKKNKKKDKQKKQAETEINSNAPKNLPSKTNDNDNPTPEKEEQPSQKEQQTKGKKKKKKQKKKQAKQEADDDRPKEETDPIDVAEPTTKETNENDEKEPPKKRKHDKDNNNTSKPTPVEETVPPKTVEKDDTNPTETQDTPTPKKSKKKRKKKKKAFDEVISISQKEQQNETEAAATSGTHTPPKKKQETSPPSSEDDDEKKPRVKFGRFNHAKSYSASMRALRTLDPATTLSKTPDKGIIRPPKHSSASKVGAGKSSGHKRKKRMST